MKQSEIEIGEPYIFYNTVHAHKKDMLGTIVVVVGTVKRKKKSGTTGASTAPPKYKLSNGRYAKASELKSIPNPAPAKK